MKKVTKATIAAVAAGALLLGGAGTVALWQSTDTVDAGQIDTGHLNLTLGTDGQWSDISDAAAPEPITNVSDFKLVPGDTVKFTQTASIAAAGKNLQGALTVGTLDAIPASLTGQVAVTVAADASAAGLVKNGNVISFADEGNYDVPVSITVAFAEGTTGSTPSSTMDQSIDLSNLSLTLDQVRP